jgi:hypothetical protein
MTLDGGGGEDANARWAFVGGLNEESSTDIRIGLFSLSRQSAGAKFPPADNLKGQAGFDV